MHVKSIGLKLLKMYDGDFSRTRSHGVILSINNIALKRILAVKNFGVLFDSKLCFNLHISTIVIEAKCVLGLIKRLLQ